jgi:hypothetical protein
LARKKNRNRSPGKSTKNTGFFDRQTTKNAPKRLIFGSLHQKTLEKTTFQVVNGNKKSLPSRRPIEWPNTLFNRRGKAMDLTKKKWLVIGGGCGLASLLLCTCGIGVTFWMYMGPSWQSPGDSFRATLMAANGGKYADADSGLADELREAFRKVNISKEMWDRKTANGNIAKIEIHKQDVRGDGAFVQYTITFKNGDHTGIRLIKGPKGERLPGQWTANPGEIPVDPEVAPKRKTPAKTPDNDEGWIIRPLEAELIKEGGRWRILKFVRSEHFLFEELLKANEQGKLVIK